MAGATPWLTAEEATAWVAFIKVADRLVTLGDGELRRRRGVTGRDYELLHHLSVTRAGLRVSELAERIHDTSSCITHRVNRLAAAGLVDKRPDPDDQRARRVRITPAGRRLLAAEAPAHVARVRAWVFDALDGRDVRDLARIATRLDTHLRRVAPPTDDRPATERTTPRRPAAGRARRVRPAGAA